MRSRVRLILVGLAGAACPLLNTDFTYEELKSLKSKGLQFIQPSKFNSNGLDMLSASYNLSRLSKHSSDAGETELSLLYFEPVRDLAAQFDGDATSLRTWVDRLVDPITYVSNEKQMLDLLRSRDPQLHCASVIVAYIPPKDYAKLDLFKHFAQHYLCKSSIGTHHMFRHGKSAAKFAVVTNASVAKRMFIASESELGESPTDLLVYKYYPPCSDFYRYQADDFRDAEALNRYDSYAASRNFNVDYDLKQLRLKLNRTKYVLSKDPSRLTYKAIRISCEPHTITSDLASLVKAVALEDMLVLPMTSKFDGMKSIDSYMSRRTDPHLVVSIEDGQEAVQITRRLGLHEIAKTHSADMLTILGTHDLVRRIYGQLPLNLSRSVEVRYIEPTANSALKRVYQLPVDSKTSDSDISTWLSQVKLGQETQVI